MSSLRLDPDNLNQHPEESISAIKESLKAFGQLKPVVVRKDSRIVVAGNGTLEAARALGWKYIAAVVADIKGVTALHYGFADNQVARLSRMNWEMVQAIIEILEAEGLQPIGLTEDEVLALRRSEWKPPEVDDSPVMVPGVNTVIQVTPDQKAMIEAAIAYARDLEDCKGWSDSQVLAKICIEWTETERGRRNAIDAEEKAAADLDPRYDFPAQRFDDDLPF